MIANMNEKGRQTKLLAAVAVLAMVVCALAVVMPSESVDAATADYTFDSPDSVTVFDNVNDKEGEEMSLKEAVAGQANGQIWNFKADATYDVTTTVSSVTGSGLIITTDVTINGNSATVGLSAIPSGAADTVGKAGVVQTAVVYITGEGAEINDLNVENMYTTYAGMGGTTEKIVSYRSILVNANNVTIDGVNLVANTLSTIPRGSTVDDAKYTGNIVIYIPGTGDKAVTISNTDFGNGSLNYAYQNTAANINLSNVTFDLTTINGGGFNIQTVENGTEGDVKAVVEAENVIVNYNAEDVSDYTRIVNNLKNAVAGVTVNLNQDVSISDDVTVANGVTVNIGANAAVAVAYGKTLTVYGTANLNGTLTGAVEIGEKGAFTAYNGSDFTGAKLSGNGDINLSAGSEEFSINGGTYVSKEVSYDINQIVTLTGDLYLTSGSIMTINGEFIIAETANLYIQDGSQLIINGAAAKLTVDGNLYVETESKTTTGTDGALFINGGTLDVNGTLDAACDWGTENPTAIATYENHSTMYVNGTMNIAGTFTIQDDTLVRFQSTAVVNIDADANFTVNGTIYSGDYNGAVTAFNNSGAVTINGVIYKNVLTISMASSGASVVVTSMSGVGLNVTDLGLETRNITVDGTNVEENSIAITATNGYVSGITITEAVTAYRENGVTTYANEMTINGTISVTKAEGLEESVTASAKATVTGPGFFVKDAVTLGQGIELALGTNTELTVSGTITATSDNSKVNNSAGLIAVDGGMIQTKEKLTEKNENLQAVKYTAQVEGVTYNYYTSLDRAMESGATTMDIYGDFTVKEDVTIPSGITVNYYGNITIGTEDDNSVTVTVENGGKFIQKSSGTVDVLGTLTVADKSTGIIRNATISSEVTSEAAPSITYTNLMKALAQTTTGTIALSDDAKINGDATLAAGVTLDTKGHKLNVEGATFTVEGTFNVNANTAGTVTITDKMANDKVTVLSEGKIVVNGTMQSPMNLESDFSKDIAGAYYAIEDERQGIIYYIQPVDDAVAKAADAFELTIDVYGENAAGDLTVTGTTEDQAILNVYGELDVSSVTLSYAKLSVKDGACFNGTVTSTVGSVELQNIENMDVEAAVDSDDAVIMTVAGTPSNAKADKNEKASVSIATGTVGVDERINAGALVSVAEGATFEISESTVIATAMTVYGTLTAIDGGNISMSSGTLVVLGTLNVAKTTEDNTAGNATVNNLFIGGTPADISTNDDYEETSGLSASVSGDFTVNGVAYLFNGSTLSEDILEDLTISTEFYVEDALWMTAYSDSAENVYIYKAPVENAELIGWKNADGIYIADFDASTSGIDASITLGQNDGKVYAGIDYDIYLVTITADNGIGTVAVDGIVLVKYSNTFTTYVDAGTHEITYTLKTGNEGSAVMTVNGTEVSGYTFTASGTEASDLVINITLSGTTPSEVTPSTGGSSDSGMGLTDYLLIILVILIVVMAIMVAMRLMRS